MYISCGFSLLSASVHCDRRYAWEFRLSEAVLVDTGVDVPDHILVIRLDTPLLSVGLVA